MKLIRLGQLSVAFIWMNLSVFGQQGLSVGSNEQTPAEYYFQVKQFGEFIDRFNFKSDLKGNLITEDFANKVPRSSYISYLLNAEDERLTDTTDSSYKILCSEFIKYVVAPNPQTINLFTGQVKAMAVVTIIYGGRDYKVNLELSPEILSDRSAKWAISRVDADCFDFIEDSLRVHFIPPNSHETSFINIKKLNTSSDPIYYFSTSLASDATLLFMTELEKKRIKIQTIEKVTYNISFPGWMIKVDEFTRSSANSGWLISDIKRND